MHLYFQGVNLDTNGFSFLNKQATNQFTWEGIWGRNSYRKGRKRRQGLDKEGTTIMASLTHPKETEKERLFRESEAWGESVLVYPNLVLSTMPHMFSDWLCIVCALYVVSMWSIMMHPKYESWRLSLEGAEQHTCSQEVCWPGTDLTSFELQQI